MVIQTKINCACYEEFFLIWPDVNLLSISGVHEIVFVSHLTVGPLHFAFSSVLNKNIHTNFSNFTEMDIYGGKQFKALNDSSMKKIQTLWITASVITWKAEIDHIFGFSTTITDLSKIRLFVKS